MTEEHKVTLTLSEDLKTFTVTIVSEAGLTWAMTKQGLLTAQQAVADSEVRQQQHLKAMQDKAQQVDAKIVEPPEQTPEVQH